MITFMRIFILKTAAVFPKARDSPMFAQLNRENDNYFLFGCFGLREKIFYSSTTNTL